MFTQKENNKKNKEKKWKCIILKKIVSKNWIKDHKRVNITIKKADIYESIKWNNFYENQQRN